MPIFTIDGKRLLFMHVPKAGGSSIERWLLQYGTMSLHQHQNTSGFPCVPQHFHAELIEELFSVDFFDYAFCVVRNPYWRLLSEYNYRMSHRRRRERILPQPGFEHWVHAKLRTYSRNPYVYSNHLRPQTEFLTKGCDVFRLEDELPALRERLQGMLHIDGGDAIPKVNVSRIAETRIHEKTAETIYRFYRSDFDRFGYAEDSYSGNSSPEPRRASPDSFDQNLRPYEKAVEYDPGNDR